MEFIAVINEMFMASRNGNSLNCSPRIKVSWIQRLPRVLVIKMAGLRSSAIGDFVTLNYLYIGHATLKQSHPSQPGSTDGTNFQVGRSLSIMDNGAIHLQRTRPLEIHMFRARIHANMGKSNKFTTVTSLLPVSWYLPRRRYG